MSTGDILSIVFYAALASVVAVVVMRGRRKMRRALATETPEEAKQRLDREREHGKSARGPWSSGREQGGGAGGLSGGGCGGGGCGGGGG